MSGLALLKVGWMIQFHNRTRSHVSLSRVEGARVMTAFSDMEVSFAGVFAIIIEGRAGGGVCGGNGVDFKVW